MPSPKWRRSRQPLHRPRRPVLRRRWPSSSFFFDWDRYNLTAEGKRVVAQAAEEFKRSGPARIVATGYTDLFGSAAYNQKLSERRADTVKQELIRLGVPASAIVAIGRGEANPLAPTKDGVREPQNRRVEIRNPEAACTAAARPAAAGAGEGSAAATAARAEVLRVSRSVVWLQSEGA